MMHPFDLLLRFGAHSDPAEASSCGRHSGHTSPTGPDATLKPHNPFPAPLRGSQRFAPYIHPDPDAGTLRQLAYLTGVRRLSSLTAAQTPVRPRTAGGQRMSYYDTGSGDWPAGTGRHLKTRDVLDALDRIDDKVGPALESLAVTAREGLAEED